MTNATDRAWRRLAACVGADSDMFFPISEEEAGPAKAVCGTCPVRDECLEWALAAREEGIWGGLTERERLRLRRQRGGEQGSLLTGKTPVASTASPTQADPEAVKEFLERLEHAAVGERFAHVGRLPAGDAEVALDAAERLDPGRWTLVRRTRPDGLVDVFAADPTARDTAEQRAG